MDLSILSLNNIITALAVIFVIYEIGERLGKIVEKINAEHDRVKKWDKVADEMTKNVQAERDKIYEKYDGRLDEMDAKIQETQAILVMALKAINAVLEGQIEQGCNGEVKRQHTALNNFITEQISK